MADILSHGEQQQQARTFSLSTEREGRICRRRPLPVWVNLTCYCERLQKCNKTLLIPPHIRLHPHGPGSLSLRQCLARYVGCSWGRREEKPRAMPNLRAPQVSCCCCDCLVSQSLRHSRSEHSRSIDVGLGVCVPLGRQGWREDPPTVAAEEAAVRKIDCRPLIAFGGNEIHTFTPSG